MIIRQTFRSPSDSYLACATEIWAFLLRKFVRARCLFPPQAPQGWRRALLLGDNHVGDLLYRSFSLGALKRGLPACGFYFLAEPGSAEILANCPWLKSVLPLRWPSTIPIFYPAYYRDMVAQLTSQAPDWSLRPVVFATETDKAAADAIWRELHFDSSLRVVACFNTGRMPSGIWPTNCFARTIVRILASRSDVQFVLCGAKCDEPLLAELKARYRLNALVNTRRLGLRSLVQFLRGCTVVVSTDSGPRYLSNAAGVPVAFVRNPSFNKVEAGVYCNTEYDMAPDVECLIPKEQDSFLRRATPELISEKVVNVLQAPLTAGLSQS